jgi:hypothetical protein
MRATMLTQYNLDRDQSREQVSATRYIGVIGSRSLPHHISDQVGDIVEDLLARGFNISTGGAVGADEFALARVIHIGLANRATLFSPWKDYSAFPVKVRAMVRQFKDEYQGSILWGNSYGKESYSIIRSALLQRNVRLIEASYGIVAFLHGESRGSMFTLMRAIQHHMPVVVFPIDRELPNIPAVKWRPIRCGGCWDKAFKAVYLK